MFNYIGPGLVPHWLSCFKVLHYYHFYYVGQTPPDMQWRNREQRDDKEHHEKTSFFSSTSVLEYGLTCNFIKKRLRHMCFAMNIAEFLRTAAFVEHLLFIILFRNFM